MFRRSSSDSSGGLPSADSSASEGFTVEVEVSDMPPTFGGQSAAASVPAALHDARAQLEQRLASLAARVHAAEAGEEGHQSLFGSLQAEDDAPPSIAPLGGPPPPPQRAAGLQFGEVSPGGGNTMGLFAGLVAADGTQARLRVLEAAAARASEESGLHSGLLSSMRSAVSEAARLAGRGMPPIPNYGSAALLPTPRRVGTAPPDADTWPAKAQHLAELCKHDVTSLSDEKAEELSVLVAFLADVANAQPHEEWATGEVLTEMAKSTAEHIFRILIECQAPSVLLEASRLFWYFSRSDNNKPVMLEEGHLQTTINAIDGRHNLPQVVFQLVVGLSNVALATDAARALIEMGIYESVSKAASANSSHLNLQLASCVLIGHSLRHKWSEAGDEQTEWEGETIEKCVASGCVGVIPRALSMLSLEDKFASSALDGMMYFTEKGSTKAQAAVLNDGGLETLLQCVLRNLPMRQSNQRAWEFLMRLTFVIFSMQSDSLQAAVDGLPDGLSLLLRCLNSEGLGRLPGLLLPHVARLLCQTDEDVMLTVLSDIKYSTPFLDVLQQRHAQLPARHRAAVLQRLQQLCFNGEQRKAAAEWRSGDKALELMATLLMEYGANSAVVEAVLGVVWLLCFTDSVKAAVKDDKHNMLTLLQTVHATMPDSGPVQERFSAIRSMCKLGGGGGGGYGW